MKPTADPEWPAATSVGFAGTVASRSSSRLRNGLAHAGVVLSLLTRHNLKQGVRHIRTGDIWTIASSIRNLALRKQVVGVTTGLGRAQLFPVVPLEPGRPLVSVVIPCFNYGRYVLEAVESVLRQTLQDVEVIVVEGGSDDQSTVEVLRHLERPRTRVLFRDGSHLVGDNRNYGIEQARGRYICCLDADDTLEPTYLEKAVFLLETYGYDVVSTMLRFFGTRSGTGGIAPAPDLRNMIRNDDVATCAVFRRLLWKSSGGFYDVGVGREHVAEDWDFWIRLAALGARIRNIADEALFNHRVHEDGSLSSAVGVPSQRVQRKVIVKRSRALLTKTSYSRSRMQRERRLRAASAETALTLSMARASAEDRRPTLVLAIACMEVGGAERLLSQLSGYLVRQGWRVIVVAGVPQDSCYGDTLDWFQQGTQEIYALPRFLQPPEWQDFFEHLMISRKPDCLLTAGAEIFSRFLPDLARRNPDMALVDLLFNTWIEANLHLLYKEHYTFAIAENDEVLHWLLEAGWEESRLRKVTSGVDVDLYSPRPRPGDLVQALRINERDLVIGFSGRLAIEKAPDVFVDIARRCQAVPGLRFVISGGGPMAKAVVRLGAKQRSTLRLDYVGLVDDMAAFLPLHDVLVLPSRHDGRPQIVMEALASGVPVIASRLGGLPEMIEDGQNGYLCAPADAAEFADRIRSLAEDRQQVARLKVGARASAEALLSAEDAFARYESVLHEAIEYRRGLRPTGPERREGASYVEDVNA